MPLSDLNFGKKKEPEKFDYMPMQGTFECQTFNCGLTVFEGKLYQNDRLLVWVCPEGHKSFIEEFG